MQAHAFNLLCAIAGVNKMGAMHGNEETAPILKFTACVKVGVGIRGGARKEYQN